MNSPSTKRIKRWKTSKSKTPEGQYTLKLTDDRFINAIGVIASTWPHIEDQMLQIFSTLLNVERSDTPVKQLYYSIVSARTRIEIMKNMLQNSWHNLKKGEEYDELLKEFSSLNALRNKYVHGLWVTHENGDTYLTECNIDELSFVTNTRKVSYKELQQSLERLEKFKQELISIVNRDIKAKIDLRLQKAGLLPK